MNQSQDSDHSSSPFYLGALARQEGKLPTDNPYTSGGRHDEWMLGWVHDRGQIDPGKSQPNDRQAASVFRLNTKRFNSPSSLRLWCWGMVLRFALLAGHPVVLIGACRTGKTLLLNKLTPGKIIDKREDAMRGEYLAITEADVPDGIYSLDECQLIKPASISKLVSAMAAQKRNFCLAAQRYRDVKEAVDAYRSAENAKRVLLVVVGEQSNPTTFLHELPQ